MLTLRLLGRPVLFDDGGTPLRFPSRKGQALVLHLALRGDRSASRAYLCHLLWGNADEERARASLRQCLRQLATLGGEHGPLVESDRSSVWLAREPIATDLDGLAVEGEALAAACRATIGLAVAIGHLLEGAEIGEEAFDEWVRDTRAAITGELAGRLEVCLAAFAPDDPDRGASGEAVARVLEAVDPLSERAQEWRIRHLAATGRRDAAIRRFEHYRATMRDELGLAPAPAVAALVADLRAEVARDGEGADGEAAAGPAPSPVPAGRARAPDFGRPRVALEGGHGMHPLPDLFRFASDEILHQLSRFRGLRCFEPADGSVPTEFAIGNQPHSDYRLRLSLHPDRMTIHLSVVEAATGEVVARERLEGAGFDDRAEAERMVARCVNAIERDVLLSWRRNGTGTTFGRWLEAFALMSRFDVDADEKALGMLEGMARDPVDSRFSLVHSSIGSILMKRRMMRPAAMREAEDGLARAAALADRALASDRLEPFNHVIAGWAAFQAGRFDSGLVRFEDALHLNPVSARTNMAAAEAFAYAGDLARARRHAETAMRLIPPPVPRYFYGYLARIEFLAGDFDACLALCERAPSNPEMRALAIAALAGKGDGRAARTAARRFLDEVAVEAGGRLGPRDVGAWLARSAMFRSGRVRTFWTTSLGRAGIPVGDGVAPYAGAARLPGPAR